MSKVRLNTVITRWWATAQQELDEPKKMPWAVTKTAPAWPVEYALNAIGTSPDLMGLVSLLVSHEIEQGYLSPTKKHFEHLVIIHCRLRAAMYRLTGYPHPAYPEKWPTTIGLDFLGRGGASGLDIAMRVLGEIDACFTRHLSPFKYDAATGEPQACKSRMLLEDENVVRWYNIVIEELCRELLLPNRRPEDIMHALPGLLAAVRSEYHASADDKEKPFQHDREPEPLTAGRQASPERAPSNDENATPLTDNEVLVLRAMAQFDGSRLLSGATIESEMDQRERLSQRTIGPIVNKLIGHELAERPEGNRRGARLTMRGRRLASKIAD